MKVETHLEGPKIFLRQGVVFTQDDNTECSEAVKETLHHKWTVLDVVYTTGKIYKFFALSELTF